MARQQTRLPTVAYNDTMKEAIKAMLLSPATKTFVDKLETAVPLIRKWHRFEYEQHFMREWRRAGKTGTRGFAGLIGNGDPGKIRTSDKQFRKLLLYPPELRGQA
jgi:hypothetical protein